MRLPIWVRSHTERWDLQRSVQLQLACRPVAAAEAMMNRAVKEVPMMPMMLSARKWRKVGIIEKTKVSTAPAPSAQ